MKPNVFARLLALEAAINFWRSLKRQLSQPTKRAVGRGSWRAGSTRIEQILICLLTLGSLPSIGQTTAAQFHLKASPQTIVWGRYDAKAPPVLRVKSGDIVDVDTLITSSPASLQRAGVPADQVEQSLRDITTTVTNKGPGGHILTGPIYIEDAQPGDALEVRILAIKLAIPYAYNAFGPTGGFLPEDFRRSKMVIIPLDRERMVGHFTNGVEIPLKPFFGSMGVAPEESVGLLSSTQPTTNAGNLDNKELVAGSSLFIPVYSPGALFEVGDGHAGQGNGEVDITALETSLTGTFQFVVHKGMKLAWPRAETATHYISMGTDKDLTVATKIAVREMIHFLVNEKHFAKEDAYMLCSVAADVDITELVDGNKGVHVMLPKAIFQDKRPER